MANSREAATLELAFSIFQAFIYISICLYVKHRILRSNIFSWRPADQLNDKNHEARYDSMNDRVSAVNVLHSIIERLLGTL